MVGAVQKLMKQLFQERQQSQRISITSGKLSFHVLIEGIVCYLTLADKNYPKKLAFQYLEELHNEFVRLYGTQIETVARPYAFIKFGKDGGPGGHCNAEVVVEWRVWWWQTRSYRRRENCTWTLGHRGTWPN